LGTASFEGLIFEFTDYSKKEMVDLEEKEQGRKKFIATRDAMVAALP
jgi:hypothetical protein